MVKRKIIALFLAIELLFTVAIPVYAESIDDKKAELEDVQKKLYNIDIERENQQKKVESASERLQVVQDKLADARRALQTVEEQQTDLEQKISKNKRSIAVLLDEMTATKKIYRKRLRDIYVNGQINYLDVLLGAKDFSDFSSRMYLLQRILARDIQLLQLLQTQKSTLETTRAALDNDKKQLDLVFIEVESKKKEVEEKAAERQVAYDTAMAEQERLDAEYNELMTISENISNMIKNLESGGGMGRVNGSGQFIWPIEGEITSYYGWRTHPIFGTQRYHSGVDIAADYGDPILAADSGTVVFADWMGGYGYAVMIDHGEGLVTLYGHNSSLNVSEGEVVQKGQTIASAGSTGYSTGPHCHFEVRVHGEVTDPLAYLP